MISSTEFVDTVVFFGMGLSAAMNILMHGFIVASTSTGCGAGEDRRVDNFPGYGSEIS